MQTFTYTALIRQDGPSDFYVSFPDVPEAISQGSTLDEARANAPDALAAALEGYLELGREFPTRAESLPQRLAKGVTWAEVAIEPAIAARALLGRELKARGLSKVGLANVIKRDEKVVRRILAGEASLDLVLDALRKLGVRPALAA